MNQHRRRAAPSLKIYYVHSALDLLDLNLYIFIALVQVITILQAEISKELPMDVLTDVLLHLQVSGKAGGELELGAPWSMAFPDMDKAVVHIVSLGRMLFVT